MPIYDYVCRQCGHVVEVIHGVHEAGPSQCPVCGGEMRRAVSAAAVHFKGSGWAKKERSTRPTTSTKDGGESAKDGGESAKDGGESAKDGTDTGAAASADSSKPADSSSAEGS